MTRTHKKPAPRSPSAPPSSSCPGGRARPALLNNNRHTFPNACPHSSSDQGFSLLWPSCCGHRLAPCPPPLQLYILLQCALLSLLCTCLSFIPLFLFSVFLLVLGFSTTFFSTMCVWAQRSVCCHIYKLTLCAPLPFFPINPSLNRQHAHYMVRGSQLLSKISSGDKPRGEHARPAPIFYGSHTAGGELFCTGA